MTDITLGMLIGAGTAISGVITGVIVLAVGIWIGDHKP